MTFVSNQAVYVQGNFNNVDKKPSAVLSDSINILSNIPATELRAALYHGDSKRLSAIPGIGKKTAERLILELQEKVKKLEPGRPSPQPRTTSSPGNVIDDTLSALVNLGYKDAQARKALEVLELAADTPVEEVLKGALKILMK